MKLKTLKDITDPDLPYCARKLDLKQEAIKWAKSIIKDGESSGSINEDTYLGGRLDSITEFFNITEEDLQ